MQRAVRRNAGQEVDSWMVLFEYLSPFLVVRATPGNNPVKGSQTLDEWPGGWPPVDSGFG
jgi:hypothetical protein